MTCILLLLIAIPSKWTLRKFPARQKAYGAYYQQQQWIQAPLKDACLEMNAESYGFTFVKNKTENLIVPGIATPSLKTFLILVHVVNAPTRMDMSLQGSWNQVLQILQV